MKIICAGVSKTGTKSLHEALEHLGYNVYDFMDHFWEHEKNWNKIFDHGWTAEDFKVMYENVDVVMDVPVFAFWEEISKAFPEAKIILTFRDADDWVNSFHPEITYFSEITPLRAFAYFFCPTAKRYVMYNRRHFPTSYGVPCGSRIKSAKFNKMILKKKYIEHNSYVLKHAPKDKLLVFNAQRGWKPLCEFLGKEIPKRPYPWRNKRGNEIQTIIMTHPFASKVKKEAVISLCLLIALFAFVMYCLLS